MPHYGQPSPVNELLRATRIEIDAELRSDGGNAPKASLHSGRRVSTARGQHTYEFRFSRWPQLLDGRPLLARPSRSRGAWTQAEVTRLPENKVRVVTSADFGQSPGPVQLRADESTTWRVLAERLTTIGEANHPVRLESAGWMVGLGSPKVGREPDPARWIANWPSKQLNSRQRLAVAQALASEVTFLWGPPGTGKTDVVAHIVEGCRRQGLSVLFLAPTKVAVDQALERVCDLLFTDAEFGSGLVQRAGEIDVESLRDRYGDYVDPERIAVRLSAQLQEELTRFTTALTTLRPQIALYDRIRGLEEALAAARDAYRAAGEARQAAAQAHGRAVDAATKTSARIRAIGQPSGIFASRQQTKLDTALVELRAANDQAGDAKTALTAAETAQKKATADIARLRADITEWMPGLTGVPARPDLVRQTELLQRRIDEAEKELRRITDAIRASCRVLGATVAKTVQSRSLLERTDVVVIDEAGMIDLPSAWYVAGLAGKRVVVAGDFRQLPAITKAADDAGATPEERAHARRWSATDVFRQAGVVTSAGAVQQDDPRMVALDTQYRMRAPICDLVNTVAYPDAPLLTGRSDGSRIPFSPLVDAPVMLIDTSGHRIAGPNHRTNAVHQAVVHELVRGLQYDGVLPARKQDDVVSGERATDRLGVIAPYRDQVTALKSTLKERLGADHDGLVETVHRFQGSQRPVIVLDTVAGSADFLGRFYQGAGLNSETCRLLNVALSRAQDHLVVIADVERLRAKLPPRSEARTMLDHLEAHAQTLTVDQLIPIRSAADLARLPDEDLTRPAFFPANEVDRAVQWDIERARSRIDIYTFLLSKVRVPRWSRLLAARAAAGVQVVIHTRAPEEQPNESAAERHAELVTRLRSVGCTVEYRERMHEKVFIVDDRVLWHGSMNLLAAMGPTDLMMRLEDPEACRQARHVMDQARREKPVFRDRRAAGPNGSSSGARKKNPPADEGVEVGAVVWGRLYLNVPRDEKEEAKATLKAQWDRDNVLWYVDASRVSRAQAHRWLGPKS